MSDLVTLTIDGAEVSVPRGTLVVDAAKKIGNNIPVFCYHPKLEPVGMCRMCLVEIGVPMVDRTTGTPLLHEDGSPELNFGPGLQTGCTVRVSPGMVVKTANDGVRAARRDVIEFILTSHPLDCPICDKGGECPLQNLTMRHGPGGSRMNFGDKIKLDKHVPLGELIYLDRERCIQCARCTRFQSEVADDPVIHFHNRGRNLEIVTMSEPGFNSYWSGNTTDICPVGALTTADFRFGARAWEMTPVASICPHCPVGCNTTMDTRREAIAGGRSVIKRVMPRQNEWVNEIWICDKGRFVHHYADAARRLRQPLVRRDGQLVEADWSEALDLVAGMLQMHAPAVAGLAGDRLANEDLFLLQKLFRQGLNSNNVGLAQSVLAGGDVVAQVGLSRDSNLQELGAGDAILVVASDLHEEAPVWWLRVKQAAERGVSLVMLNARATRLDKFASQRVQYQVGQALASVRQLLTLAKVETDSPPGDALGAAADLLVNANNLVIFYGAEGLTVDESDDLARLLANLLLLENSGGHAGRPNNGLVPVWPGSNTQGAWDMGVHPAFGPGYAPLAEPGLTAAEVYEAAAAGEINALFVVGADPVGDGLMASRTGLESLIVQDLFLTETAAQADVVLPAQSWAEREGTFTSGERRVQRFYPALRPLGTSKPDWQILALLGERVGLDKPPMGPSLVFRDIAATVPQYGGMDYRSLAQVTEQWPLLGDEDLYYGGTAFENNAGLGQQWAAAAESQPPGLYEVTAGEEPAPAGLMLVSTRKLYTPGTLINQSLVLAGRLAETTLQLRADDAQSLGLAQGDVVVVNDSVQATVRLDEETPDGLALLTGGPRRPGAVSLEIGRAIVEEKDVVT